MARGQDVADMVDCLRGRTQGIYLFVLNLRKRSYFPQNNRLYLTITAYLILTEET